MAFFSTASFLPGTTGWDSTFANLPTWSAYYTTNANAITIMQYAGFGGAVTVPATVYGLPVTSIGTNAFAYNGSVTNITIPSSVTNIADEAFYLCTNLTTFYFQGNAPSLGSDVFWGITNATVYFLPDVTGWASTFAGLSAAAMTYSYRYGPSVWPWMITAGVGSLEAAGRVASGRHFYSDVMVGAAAGTAIGIMIPLIHKRNMRSKITINPQVTADSAQLVFGTAF